MLARRRTHTRRSRVSHACYVRVPRPRSPLTHTRTLTIVRLLAATAACRLSQTPSASTRCAGGVEPDRSGDKSWT
eukprot:4740853-Prymnesium_polylepis.1